MKIFLDTEFTGLYKDTDLISLALVPEYGNDFYAEFTDFNRNYIDSWLQENVIQNLIWYNDKSVPSSKHFEDFQYVKGHSQYIAFQIRKYMNDHPAEEFEMWSSSFAFDWVLFQSLFGSRGETQNLLPEKIINHSPYDIRTTFKNNNIDPTISKEEFLGKGIKKIKTSKYLKLHNALYDARIMKITLEKLERSGKYNV